MPTTMTTIRELREWVRTSLGFSQIAVELSDGDIDTCIGDACRAFTRYQPGIAAWPITNIGAGQASEIVLGSSGRITRFFIEDEEGEEHKGLMSVFDVHFLRKLQFTDFIGIENPFYLDAVMRAFQGGTAGDYMADLTYLEQAKHVFSSFPEWRTDLIWDRERQKRRLSLYIDVSSLGVSFEFYDICYFFFYAYEPSDAPQNGIGTIPLHYDDWFRRYTLARAKQILGRQLGKFDGVPSPFGGSFATDGQILRQEGLAEEKDLRVDAEAFQRQLPIITG